MISIKNRPTFIAIGWLLLLIFFTYTSLVATLFMADGDFLTDYVESQHQSVALFVNIGLLCMVSIDYFCNKPYLDLKYAIILFIGIISLFVVYAHSGILFTKTGYLYKRILNNNWLSFFAHIVFLGTVLIIKYWSLRKPDAYVIATEIE